MRKSLDRRPILMPLLEQQSLTASFISLVLRPLLPNPVPAVLAPRGTGTEPTALEHSHLRQALVTDSCEQVNVALIQAPRRQTDTHACQE
jgi:hypothetical protein